MALNFRYDVAHSDLPEKPWSPGDSWDEHNQNPGLQGRDDQIAAHLNNTQSELWTPTVRQNGTELVTEVRLADFSILQNIVDVWCVVVIQSAGTATKPIDVQTLGLPGPAFENVAGGVGYSIFQTVGSWSYMANGTQFYTGSVQLTYSLSNPYFELATSNTGPGAAGAEFFGEDPATTAGVGDWLSFHARYRRLAT